MLINSEDIFSIHRLSNTRTTLGHRMVSLLQRFPQFRGHSIHYSTTLGHRMVSYPIHTYISLNLSTHPTSTHRLGTLSVPPLHQVGCHHVLQDVHFDDVYDFVAMMTPIGFHALLCNQCQRLLTIPEHFARVTTLKIEHHAHL